ncbi:Alkaline phosphatase [Anaeromyxobacter dehalogenans 2CP-1]|uniref:Alkaline phosphatase n=1 Tax=Anaeromyxobacter dehalogenans (strain ATCC BAA-258 / DSM 21875 / 2CP-1) TaxID=455488 RepID=B8JF35_ANAD2|nr:alkaline phosphatase [Anaeromyxobacter dehalogenans]ACL64392.1 Alkaline phosphatase [Anaeromyxobacter dehalogenans 2CP-1]
MRSSPGSFSHRALAALAAGALALGGCSSDSSSSPPPAPPRNVLFFLGDGMGMTTLTAARIYSVGEDGALTIDALPETGFVKTYSNDAQVTDSAPSMAAYMTGVKANNEVISMSPDTRAFDAAGVDYLSGADSACPPSGNGAPVTTLLELAKAAGRATGVVTTTRVTHATPAATYAHVCHRDAENTIAAQLVPGAGFNAALGSGVDVVLGGGRRHFLPAAKGGARTDGRDLVAELKAAGWAYASTEAELDAAPAGGRLLGLFTGSHMAYDLDRDPAAQPSLAEMTGKALDVLTRNPKGFFLMVEGGRIDHALHETTAKKALQDTVAFDHAIATALARMQQVDPGLKNTLVVVTADHDHTLVLNGYARRTGPTTAAAPGVLGLVRNVLTGAPDPDVGGLPYTVIGFGNGESRPATRTALDDATVSASTYHQEAAVPMPAGGETHGGTDVFIGAAGLGAERFTGVIDNTAVFTLVRRAAGL